MRGNLFIYYPEHGTEVRHVRAPLPQNTLTELVGGLLQIVPMWDHFVTEEGVVVPCTVFCNEEAHLLKLPANVHATAFWHYVIRMKGEKRIPSILHGPIVVVYGDEDFMDTL